MKAGHSYLTLFLYGPRLCARRKQEVDEHKQLTQSWKHTFVLNTKACGQDREREREEGEAGSLHLHHIDV